MGFCYENTQAVCTGASPSGSYQGDGTSCTPNPCPTTTTTTAGVTTTTTAGVTTTSTTGPCTGYGCIATCSGGTWSYTLQECDLPCLCDQLVYGWIPICGDCEPANEGATCYMFCSHPT
jgi:hypothetical protein